MSATGQGQEALDHFAVASHRGILGKAGTE
jgi:hypothetical protein